MENDGPSIRRLVIAGLVLAGLGFGGFGAWAAWAPLNSAAVAPSVIIVDGNRKTVQHLEGGIIAEILARDGDRVAAGQPLLRLDDLETRSLLAQFEAQRIALLAQEARLTAERDGLPAVVFPAALRESGGDPSAAISGQERIFTSRRASMEGQVRVTRQRIAQIDAQIAALEAQRKAGHDQSAFIAEEIQGVEEMVAKGLERRPRLLALMRQSAEMEGNQGNLANRIAQAREAIAQAELEIIGLEADRASEVALELRDVQARRAELEEKLAAARGRWVRRDILAPTEGTVLNSRYFAPGAVVPPGGAVLDLVPQDDRLVIEAHVNPLDIDVVHPGLPAKVVLTAFKSRVVPPLEGQVVRVSADAIKDENSQQTHYAARIVVDARQLDMLQGVTLVPGMLAETLIVTGERTVLEYLLQPVRDGMRRAFREE